MSTLVATLVSTVEQEESLIERLAEARIASDHEKTSALLDQLVKLRRPDFGNGGSNNCAAV